MNKFLMKKQSKTRSSRNNKIYNMKKMKTNNKEANYMNKRKSKQIKISNNRINQIIKMNKIKMSKQPMKNRKNKIVKRIKRNIIKRLLGLDKMRINHSS